MSPRGAAHEPVMLKEAIAELAIDPNGVYVDATAGGGGHAVEIANRLVEGRLIALDLDPRALAAARGHLEDHVGRVTLVRANYRELARVLDRLGVGAVDGVLFDLGLSSRQLADPERGFSFREDAPLDMRYDPDQALTAREIVNRGSERELVRVLREYGEERWAARIAREIARARGRAPIETTGQLVACIEKAIPEPAKRLSFRRGLHPATRTFQALRIAVNDELGNLEEGLAAAFGRLRSGGRLVVLTYHSLEDRMVKRFMRERARGCICPPELPECRCGRAPEAEITADLAPSGEEVEANPRARSARLRALRKR